jgi:hypothetical protein
MRGVFCAGAVELAFGTATGFSALAESVASCLMVDMMLLASSVDGFSLKSVQASRHHSRDLIDMARHARCATK